MLDLPCYSLLPGFPGLASTGWAWSSWSLTTWWSSCSTPHASSTSAMRTSRRGIDSEFRELFCLALPDQSPPALVSPPCSFTLWALLFVIARLLTLTLSVLTFSFGLPRIENQGFSLADGNFNVLTVR